MSQVPSSSDEPEEYCCPRHGAYRPDRNLCDYQRWACPACRRAGELASASWHAAWGLFERWRLAEVPVHFRNRRFANFRVSNPQLQLALAAARSLVAQRIHAVAFIGSVGNGKTHLGAAILAAAVRDGHSALWVSTPRLLTRLRACFSDQATETEHMILTQLGSVQFLVMDEIGAKGKATEWEASVLSRVIDQRYSERKALVLSGNVETLSDAIGERGADRIVEMGVTIAMTGESYRHRAVSDPDLRVPDDFLPPDQMEWVENEKGLDRRHELSTQRLPNLQRRTG